MKNVSVCPRRKSSGYIPSRHGTTRHEVLNNCLTRLLLLISCTGIAGMIFFLVALS